MRRLLILVVAVIVCWWLLPWGDDPFACGAAIADETSDECPSNLSEAADNQQWAEQRIAAIIDKKRTTGLFFWGDGNKSFVSGEDEDAERAVDAMKDAGLPFPERGAPHPAAAHVETKIAAWMVEEDIVRGVVVINNERGPCGADGQGPFTCAVAVRAILPKGSSLAVWFPGAVESVTLEGEGG